MGSGIEDPFQRFLYRLSVGALEVAGFNKVSGLKVEVERTNYSEGTFGGHPIALPGIMSPGDLTLERGLTTSEEIWEWVLLVVDTKNARPSLGTPAPLYRKDITIELLDRDGVTVTKSWRVVECWPMSYELDDLDSGSSDVLLEKLQLAHEGFYQL